MKHRPGKSRFAGAALALLMVLVLPLLLSACIHDPPPRDDSPLPPSLDGVFTSELGSLTFNGDGKSIVVELTEAGAERTGLPAGTSQGTYYFLYQGGLYRYDKSEYLQISIDGTNTRFRNSVGDTDENTVAIYPDADTTNAVFFRKTAQQEP